jgi:hypothetical protein
MKMTSFQSQLKAFLCAALICLCVHTDAQNKREILTDNIDTKTIINNSINNQNVDEADTASQSNGAIILKDDVTPPAQDNSLPDTTLKMKNQKPAQNNN